MQILYFAAIFADLTKARTLVCLFIGAAAIALLFSAKKIAVRILDKKYPGTDKNGEKYKDMLLEKTLMFKYIAAGLAVCAGILSLIW